MRIRPRRAEASGEDVLSDIDVVIAAEGVDAELMAGVIRVPGKNRQRSVDLFCQHHTGEFMGKCDAAKGENQVGARVGGRSPAAVRADGKDDCLRSGVAKPAQLGGKLFAG